MVEFINTVDIIGDELLMDSIISRSVTEYSDDEIKMIGSSAFRGCTALTAINCPEVTTINSSACMLCGSLTKADFSAVTLIKSGSFNGCSALASLIIRNPSLCLLGHANALTNTPIAFGTGYIYVPRALIDQYKAADKWSTYANQFRVLEDYTDDGTTTGEFVIPFSETDFSQGYSVEWDYTQESPALTRMGLAASFSDPAPATALDAAGSSPFDNIMPWAGMKKYNIIDGEVAYSEDDEGFSMTDYDTMVYIPEFYYAAWKDEANSKWRWSISPTPKAGYRLHPGSGRYISRYGAFLDGDMTFSLSGVQRTTGELAEHRTFAHNKGDKWWMLDIATWSAIQLLYLVEFATFNSREKLGTGAGAKDIIEGATDEAVYHSYNGGGINQYRWIELPWGGSAYVWADGFLANSCALYIGTENNTFDGTLTNLQYTGITTPGQAYITGYGYSDKFPWAFLPDAASGGNGSNYTTTMLVTNSGLCGCVVGGYYSPANWHGMLGLGMFRPSGEWSKMCSRLIFIP